MGEMSLMHATILILIVVVFLFFYLLHHKDEAMADENSLNKEIIVHGYWLDNNEPFAYRAIIGAWNEYDDYADDYIFYYFDPSESIIGTHSNEFHIHSYEEVNNG
jgi:hypothetical protein